MIQSEKCREKKRKERRKEETRKEKKPKRKQKKNPQRKSITNGEESRAQRSLRKGISIPLRFSLSFSSPFPPLVRFALIPFPFFSAFHSSSPAAHDCPRLPPTKQISFVLNNIMSWDFLSSFSNFLFSFFFFLLLFRMLLSSSVMISVVSYVDCHGNHRLTTALLILFWGISRAIRVGTRS